MTLVKQHAKNEAVSVLVWSVILGLVAFVTTYLWNVLRSGGTLLELQRVLTQSGGVVQGFLAPGIDLTSLDGWIRGYSMGGWVGLLFGIFTALFVAGIVTREMDRRTMEFVLSLPVSRAEFLVSRWLVLAGSLAVMHLTYLIGVLAGVAALGMEGHPGRYALAMLNSALVFLFIGTLQLLVSLFIDDYGTGSGALLGIVLGLQFFHMGTGEASGALKSLRAALPFGWYDANAIIGKGEVPWGHLGLLVGGTIILLALSIWVFQRKQITV